MYQPCVCGVSYMRILLPCTTPFHPQGSRTIRSFQIKVGVRFIVFFTMPHRPRWKKEKEVTIFHGHEKILFFLHHRRLAFRRYGEIFRFFPALLRSLSLSSYIWIYLRAENRFPRDDFGTHKSFTPQKSDARVCVNYGWCRVSKAWRVTTLMK